MARPVTTKQEREKAEASERWARRGRRTETRGTNRRRDKITRHEVAREKGRKKFY